MSRTPWLVLLAAGFGGAAITAAWRSRWRPAAMWTAVGLIGYAASLQLIDAGPFVRYQHYLHPADWIRIAPIPVGLLGAQLIAVLWGGWWRRHDLAALAAGWPRHALVLAGLTFVLTAAALSADPIRLGGELAVASAVQALHLATAMLVATSVPEAGAAALDRWAERLLGPEPDRVVGRSGDRLLLAMMLVAALVPALLSIVTYQLHPHVPDEVVYLIHARYLAEGRLFLPTPEPISGFELDLMFADRGRWYSPVPPGWPAMLAVGVRLGAPWLINPLLNAANVWLINALVREIYDRRTARLSAVIYALSPWNLFLAMSVLTHTFTITVALIAGLAVAKFRRGGRGSGIGAMAIGGIAIGLVSLIRPLEGLALAALLGAWTLGVRPWRRLAAGTAVLVIATAAIAALVLPYNRLLTGSPTRFPLMAYSDAIYGPGSNAMGFGANRGLGWSGLDPLPGHGPVDVVINTLLNLFAVNIELLGWASGSLFLVALFVFRGRLGRADRLMVTVVATVIGLHAFYWFGGGPDFGARYWYLASIPLVTLAARAVLASPLFERGSAARGRGAALVIASALGSILVFVPWRAGDKYFHYRGMRPDLRSLAATNRFGADLVLVRGRRHPDYASAAVLNPLEPRADRTIYAWDRDSTTRQAVVRRFPDRRIWLVDGPSITGAGYRVVAGPLEPATLGRNGR